MIVNEAKCLMKIKTLSQTILANPNDTNTIIMCANTIKDILSILDSDIHNISMLPVADEPDSMEELKKIFDKSNGLTSGK